MGINPFFFYFNSSTITNKGRSLFNGARFSTWTFEKQFAKQSDPLFCFYLFYSLALCLLLMAIKLLVTQLSLRWIHISLFLTTLTFIMASLIYTYYNNHKVSCLLRMLIWFLIASSLVICSLIDIVVVCLII